MRASFSSTESTKLTSSQVGETDGRETQSELFLLTIFIHKLCSAEPVMSTEGAYALGDENKAFCTGDGE